MDTSLGRGVLVTVTLTSILEKIVSLGALQHCDRFLVHALYFVIFFSSGFDFSIDLQN